jgi:hypothetical protein
VFLSGCNIFVLRIILPRHSSGSRNGQQQWSGTGFVGLWGFVPLSAVVAAKPCFNSY